MIFEIYWNFFFIIVNFVLKLYIERTYVSIVMCVPSYKFEDRKGGSDSMTDKLTGKRKGTK